MNEIIINYNNQKKDVIVLENEKTNLCWDINDKSIQVDGSKILKSIQGMENRA